MHGDLVGGDLYAHDLQPALNPYTSYQHLSHRGAKEGLTPLLHVRNLLATPNRRAASGEDVLAGTWEMRVPDEKIYTERAWCIYAGWWSVRSPPLGRNEAA